MRTGSPVSFILCYSFKMLSLRGVLRSHISYVSIRKQREHNNKSVNRGQKNATCICSSRKKCNVQLHIVVFLITGHVYLYCFSGKVRLNNRIYLPLSLLISPFKAIASNSTTAATTTTTATITATRLPYLIPTHSATTISPESNVTSTSFTL